LKKILKKEKHNMPRLPKPGSDDGTWGDILNDFLRVEHNADGSQKPLPQSTIIDLEDDLAAKVADDDARLSDQRVPTDDSVTNAKVSASAAIDQSKIANLEDDLAAKADSAELAGMLTAANNLSDVEDPAEAIANLGAEPAIAPGTYVPSAGVRVVPFGDSTVIANSDNTPVWGNRDLFAWAHLLSKGTFRYVRNAGVGGDDAGEALARFDTAVAPYNPDVVPIVLGINDAVSGRTLAAYAADMRAIVAKVRAINALPVLFTVAPNLNTGGIQQRIADENDWLRVYSSENGIPLVDTNAPLTDPATGSYLTAYDLDGTHQNAAGAKVMGQAFVDALPGIGLRLWTPPLAVSNTADAKNIVTNGLFLTNSAGLGTGWSKTGGTASIVAGSSLVKGNWQRLTDAAVEAANIRQNIVLAPNVAGDVLEFSGRVRTVEGTSTATWSLFLNLFATPTLVTYVANVQTEDLADGAFTLRVTIPASSTSLQVQLARTVTVPGTGYSEMAQITVRNLTQRGVLAA
jgi:lysophospholipase L1-like esterase